MTTALEKARQNIIPNHSGNGMIPSFTVSNQQTIDQLLSISDLTEDEAPENIIQKMLKKIVSSLQKSGFPEVTIIRGPKAVSAIDNFDSLLFPVDNLGRSSTYTRWIDEDTILRTHMSALVPSLLREMKGNVEQKRTYVFPGLVYRRDVIDPRHLDCFHQMDIWTLQSIKRDGLVTREDLLKLVSVVVNSVLGSKIEIKIIETEHPYTKNGIEVYALKDGKEIEVLECGLIHPEVLRSAGIDPLEYCGLALGMGFERLVMAKKSLPDIRLIRSVNPKVMAQMQNLEPYKKVSNQPAIKRDLSFCIPVGKSEEDICSDVREAFGDAAELLEEVQLITRTNYNELEEIAKERLGALEKQDNVLVRIILRHPDRTLEKKEADELYRNAYPKLHQGTKMSYLL